MILTNENYFNEEIEKEYLSVSQYKSFCGTIGSLSCEARAMAKLERRWEEKKTTALLIGSYVDAYFEGTLDKFKKENPDIFTSKNELKSSYKKAEEIIHRIEQDTLFLNCMCGEKQVIMTGKLFGAEWKIKIDSYLPDKAIVDLKVMKALKESFYVKEYGYIDFIQQWGYDIQGAIYQEIVYQNTGQRLPFYIAAISKEIEPDLEIIYIDDDHLKEKLMEVEHNIPKILALKKHEIEPIRCGKCDYCKHTKILKKPIHYTQLISEI